MPQQRKKEESERLRGERDKIEFIDNLVNFHRFMNLGMTDLSMTTKYMSI